MNQLLKVKSDGNHFYGVFPSTCVTRSRGTLVSSYKRELFDKYFLEAQEKFLNPNKIVSYILDRIREEHDVSDWLSTEECQMLYKNKKRNEHKRLKRYEDKLFLTDWDFFVTFTYDSKKVTEESFEKRLKQTFSSFAIRHDWKVIAVPEEGEENGRKHWHCLLSIPEDGMVGQLFLNHKYSRKRHKNETWTDNTYFNKRFGISVWERIERKDLVGGRLRSYLVKYLSKSGNKIFYSRGIPTEIYMMIDTERDVAASFNCYGVKVLLWDHLFFCSKEEPFEMTEADFRCLFRGYILEDLPKIP